MALWSNIYPTQAHPPPARRNLPTPSAPQSVRTPTTSTSLKPSRSSSQRADSSSVHTTPRSPGKGIMVMHHGAGYSALSFACLAKQLEGLLGKEMGVLAFDARRHGKTTPMEAQSDQNLSMDVLVDDLVALVQAAPTVMATAWAAQSSTVSVQNFSNSSM
ncbi:hypothetical protein BU15DRAFT_69428 [Melanogaster broomeanus]|nr:hypothetical protein BU15DRAFT_69428 [Melanogaster broomeanus]